MNMLDEKGFIFISSFRAYQVRMFNGQPWLCYWHEYNKCFVTLRPINQSEIWSFEQCKLSDDRAEFYYRLQEG